VGLSEIEDSEKKSNQGGVSTISLVSSGYRQVNMSLKPATYTFSKNLCTYFRQLRMEE